MKLLQRGVALALLTTFTLASETALAYEQDKTYKITVLHTNDHHGIFGAMNMANMVWRRKKRWWMVSAKRLRLKAVACCYFPVATLTLACPSLTYRMPNLIFAV
ncbi:protein UshA precursor [includes: UDP-sugar hydrolase; 5'-nucleotidase] [Escherichia coli]|uniref:Protein UshA [includes: UDP-sugar hydrolase 5'-nucleotidase] n=1 Tax=Escherichia coli TaxID=562 RepID=A0A2X3KHD1_ECOLX|nr:protein UshA precursor [includes: UDP-sugar hydrolase; 5'-nucleotidase] [Escherichia coli]